MDLETKDQGVIEVILKRFEHERYPQMLALKERVDNGAVLDKKDLEYLGQVLEETHQILAIVTRHPEYASLIKAGLVMYEEIMTKSQLNNNLA
ncbi:hypothetical protein [Colwellia sp. 12G3]|uniref:hypothetical protein n=1 Tax=Colwellia sp. 12G3 TaxID=2058299 RepID=UPI000C32E7A3|nr:hypothetical protein [Colwellia sp. 12G3]PKI13963.1 hypothetical protein CXF71_15355 [Colwellia sp. 12G3]